MVSAQETATAHNLPPDLEGGYAIIGDLHGHADLLLRATEIIDPSVVRFVVQDILDKGPEVKTTLEIARDIGAIGLACNHGWACANALHFPEHQDHMWLRGWSHNYQRNTLESFGLVQTGDARRDAANLRAIVETEGLERFFFGSFPYIEPDSGDFIAIHAGLTDDPWELQKRELDRFNSMPARYEAAPDQIFDDDYSLSNSDTAFRAATDKIVVTGHSHYHLSASERVTDGGKRIRVASQLHAGDPLFIYLTKSHEIVQIDQVDV